MVDKVISKLGVGFALLFVFGELTYVNTKSLLYLTGEAGLVDQLFSVVGAMAFSSVTILVMRKSKKQWVKIVFPVFDAVLMFCGFNLLFAHEIANGTDNPIRFCLSIFMAVFTGLITYSLGLINHTDHVVDKTETQRNAEEVERIKAETSSKLDDLEEQRAYLSSSLDDSVAKVDELNVLLDHEKKKRQRYEKAAKEFMVNHVCFLAWGAKKKNESNRTPDETKAIALAEKIKAGESVRLEEVLA
jgi:hypothetical protein